MEECSFHRRIRLWGYCKWPHKKITPANGKNGLCQRCKERGFPQKIYTNKICLECKKK